MAYRPTIDGIYGSATAARNDAIKRQAQSSSSAGRGKNFRRGGPSNRPRKIDPADRKFYGGASHTSGGVAYTPAPANRPQPSPSPQPQPTPTYGGGGGGSGGGGGGGGASTPPTSTTPEEAAPPKSLDLDEINAALEAISAMFDLQEGELSSEMQAARQAFDFLKQNLMSAQERAVEQATNVAAGRGILRSGLFLQETGRIEEEGAGAISQAQSEKAARERAIQQKIAGLNTAEKAQRAAEARRLAREQVGTKEAIGRALELV